MLSTLLSSARRAPGPSSLSVPAVFAATLLTALTGCAGFSTVEPTNSVANTVAMKGSVHGGQQPVIGSHVHLYEVGATGYGSASNNIITTATGSDAYGNYVVTDASGDFSLPTASYTCTKPANQTYLLATGGNPGFSDPTTNNSAITLVLSLGKCGNIASLSGAVINEVSTVAAITALQQYFTDVTHIGSSANGKPDLVIAANLANDLVSVTTGVASTINGAGTGVTPQAKIDSLANSLAPCINSATPSSTDCANLFAAATPSGGTAPSDVATAMFNIAENPTLQVATIYNLATAAAPFAPTLSSAPNDWALPIVFTGGGGITSPQNVVIDASGNAWVSNCPSCAGTSGTDSIVEISPSGVYLSGAAGYTTNIHKPTGLAIDNNGKVWSTNLAITGTVAQIVRMTGGSVDFAFNDSTVNTPTGIAIDASNNAWVTMQKSSGTIVQVTSSGTRTLAAVTPSGFHYPTGIGIDGSGFIFAAGTFSNNVVKLTSAGAISATYTGNGFNEPIGISVDNADNVYTIDNNSSALSHFSGSTGTGTSNDVGISDASVVAIDGLGTSWIPDYVSSSNNIGNVIHVSAAGAILGAEAGLQDASLSFSSAGAIDGAGNIWVTSPATGAVTLFVGVAAPVVTPIAAGTAANTLGTRP